MEQQAKRELNRTKDTYNIGHRPISDCKLSLSPYGLPIFLSHKDLDN